MQEKKVLSKGCLLIGAALTAIALTGCGGEDSSSKNTTTGTVKDTATQPQAATSSKATAQTAVEPSTPEVNLNKKLAVYIKCYNSLTARLTSSVNRYASWVKDMKNGPTGKETLVYGLYSVDNSQITQCKEQITAVSTLPPASTDLDKAAISFIDSSEKLGNSISKLYPYYDEKDYKDDGFKKGKELHAEFAANAESYFQTLKAFSALISQENDKRQIKDMQDIEKKEGRNIEYLRLALLIQAKQLVAILYSDDFAIDDTKKLLDQYSALLSEADAYSKEPKNKELMKRYGSMTESSFKSLVSNAADFNKVAKERFRRVRDKTPYSSGEKMNLNVGSGWMVDGSPDKLQRAYNQLVGAFNSW